MLKKRDPVDILQDIATLALMSFELPSAPPEQPNCNCLSGFLP